MKKIGFVVDATGKYSKTPCPQGVTISDKTPVVCNVGGGRCVRCTAYVAMTYDEQEKKGVVECTEEP